MKVPRQVMEGRERKKRLMQWFDKNGSGFVSEIALQLGYKKNHC